MATTRADVFSYEDSFGLASADYASYTLKLEKDFEPWRDIREGDSTHPLTADLVLQLRGRRPFDYLIALNRNPLSELPVVFQNQRFVIYQTQTKNSSDIEDPTNGY